MNIITATNAPTVNHSGHVQPDAYPTINQAWWLMGFFFLMQLPAALPAGALTWAADYLDQPWLNALGQLLAYVVALALTIWRGFRNRGSSALAWRSAPVVAYPVAAVGLLAFSTLLEPLISAIPMPEFLKELIEKLFTKDVIITAVVAAPILEEVLFRGIILDGLLKHYSPAKAVIWSGVIFGCIHLIPTQAVNAIFLGIALGWIYYRTRSLYLCMFLHFVNNATSSLTFLVDDTMDMSANLTRSLIGDDTLYVGVLLGCAAICYGCYAFLNRQLPQPVTHQAAQ